MCYMPFGWGPRNCLGMRFAQVEAKMALTALLRKFKFEKTPETEVSNTQQYTCFYCYFVKDST